MTLSLRRKRRITVPARKSRAWIVTSLLALGLLGGSARASGQPVLASSDDSRLPAAPAPVEQPPTSSGQTLHFSKEAAMPMQAKPLPTWTQVPRVPAAVQPIPTSFPRGPEIQRVQAPGAKPPMQQPGTDDTQEYQIQLEPPGEQRLFGHLESEKSLQEHMRQEALSRKTPERIDFPEEPVISTKTYTPRMFPPATEFAEPAYVCYGKLLFEDKNTERYGWDMGFIQPFVSAGLFYLDVAFLPYHIASHACGGCYECSAGYCLPGDPVPYLLYPVDKSLLGTATEAGTVLLLVAIFP